MAFIANGYRPSLTNSVWVADREQVQTQLDGLLRLPDIEYIGIALNGRVHWEAGKETSARTVVNEFSLVRRHRGENLTIGQVKVVASVDTVLARMWDHLFGILLRNAVKTALVAGFVLLIFQYLVTRHLSRIAAFVRGVDPAAPRGDTVTLERPASGRWRPDILDAVSDSVNALSRALRSSHDDLHRSELALRELNTDLEARVRSRTAELQLALQHAEKASRAKTDFLSHMSHELRTPMNAILGFAQIIEMANPTPQQLKWVTEIRRAGDHLMQMINDLLDLTRIEAGKISIRLEPIVLLPIIEEAVAIVAPSVAARRLVLRQELASAAAIHVLADRLRLRQVLVNLLSNAVKYNNPQGRITIRCEQQGAAVRLSVADTGIGISPDKAARLFQPFERLGAEDRAVEGVGIGLALSRQFAELMGAQLGFESTAGAGSVFWVDLPLAGAAQTSDARPAASAAAGDLRCDLLWVEDQASNVEVLQAYLAHYPNVHLRIARTGGSGLAMMRARRPDLILLDINLPDRSGHQVLAELRRDPGLHDLPVIAVSADAMAEDIRLGLKAGFDRYHVKPLDFDAVMQDIAALLRRPRAA
jgi:signal transduction histidine kinase/CheY-like chemotaxis protein